MASGAGRPANNWSPPRHSPQQGNNQPPSPASVNNVPRSSFVPEIVIPRRTSSTDPSAAAAGSSSNSMQSPSYSSAGGSLLRPPSQQARYQQQQQQQGSSASGNGPAASTSTGSYPTHYSSSANSSRYGGAGAGYDAPPVAAPTASHEDSLADVMGSSGVDLRAEEEAMQSQTRFGSQSHSQQGTGSHASYRGATSSQGQASASSSSQPRRTSGGLFLEVYPLSMKVHSIAAMHGLGVEPDVLNYLSLTARTRFRNLAEAMIAAARHRIWSSAHSRPPPLYQEDPAYASASASNPRHKGRGRSDGSAQMDIDPDNEPKPMYHEQLLSDPSKQLSAIEKAEREEEARARRRRAARVEREAAEQAFLAALLEEEKAGGGGGRGDMAVDGENADVAFKRTSSGGGAGDAERTINGSHAPGEGAASSSSAAAAGSAAGEGRGAGVGGSKAKKSKGGPAAGGSGDGADGSGGPKKKRQKKNSAAAGADGSAASGSSGAAAAGAAGAAGAGAGGTGRISKKYNLSEDVQKRLTDSTATQLIGGKAYGWMSGTGGGLGGGKGKGKGKGQGGGAVKSKLPAPRFGSESAKRAEDDDEEYDDAGPRGSAGAHGRGGPASAASGKHDAPATSTVRKRSDSHATSNSPTKLSGSNAQPLGGHGVGAWGDVAARKAAREEAERQRRLRVQMRDALFVLEEEVAGGVQGRGAGGRALMKARAKLGGVAQVVQNPFEAAGPGL
ncbi:hypothetical protein OC835_004332 [Tilletia horrida]|nr:hypothetical protein OC835_004332 [Tilletia horrida]